MVTNKKSGEEFLLGGQAVIEGVMMRSPNYYTVAVRRPQGGLLLQRRFRPRITARHPLLNWPIIRGVAVLGQTLSIGISALNFSASVYSEDGDEDKGSGKGGGKQMGKGAMALTFFVAFVLAFVLMVFLPLWLTDLLRTLMPALENPLLYNAVDGIFRVLVFLAYIVLISLMRDIRRVFEYHGAEHMSVHAGEALRKSGSAGEGETLAALTVEEAEKHSPYHARCGTSFLLFVMVISIVVFSFTPVNEAFWLKLVIRTPLIPLIAGISYEVLKLSARLRTSRLFAALSAPGLWLQRLTARRPDKKQLEVAVAALRDVAELEERFHGDPLPPEMETAILAAADS